MNFNPVDHLGQRVRVRSCFGGYPLPEGLPEGAEVVLESFEPGYWTVSYNDSRFVVGIPCVGDSGTLPETTRPIARQPCKPRVRPAGNRIDF